MFAYKIVLIGDFGVGKTSLISRFVENSFSEEYLSTIGVTMSRKQLSTNDGVDSTMIIWDTEGKTEHNTVFKQYLKGAKGFIIVADLTRQRTIDSIRSHIELCEEVVPNTPICVALNKCDLQNSVARSINDIKKITPNVLNVYTTSAKIGDSVNNIFHDLNKTIIQKIERCST